MRRALTDLEVMQRERELPPLLDKIEREKADFEREKADHKIRLKALVETQGKLLREIRERSEWVEGQLELPESTPPKAPPRNADHWRTALELCEDVPTVLDTMSELDDACERGELTPDERVELGAIARERQVQLGIPTPKPKGRGKRAKGAFGG